jgi:hypothetical protein
LIEADSIFQSEPLAAYTVAWALSFYLSERMPNEFAEYLKLQRKRRFNSYSAADRASDFRHAFQLDPASLALHMQRLLQK